MTYITHTHTQQLVRLKPGFPELGLFADHVRVATAIADFLHVVGRLQEVQAPVERAGAIQDVEFGEEVISASKRRPVVR